MPTISVISHSIVDLHFNSKRRRYRR